MFGLIETIVKIKLMILGLIVILWFAKKMHDKLCHFRMSKYPTLLHHSKNKLSFLLAAFLRNVKSKKAADSALTCLWYTLICGG